MIEAPIESTSVETAVRATRAHSQKVPCKQCPRSSGKPTCLDLSCGTSATALNESSDAVDPLHKIRWGFLALPLTGHEIAPEPPPPKA